MHSDDYSDVESSSHEDDDDISHIMSVDQDSGGALNYNGNIPGDDETNVTSHMTEQGEWLQGGTMRTKQQLDAVDHSKKLKFDITEEASSKNKGKHEDKRYANYIVYLCVKTRRLN